MQKKWIARFLSMILIITLCFGSGTVLSQEQSNEGTGVPILVYHNILAVGESNPDPVLHTDINQLRQQLTSLKDAGYQAITYEDYYNYVEKGTSLPAKPIIITFDDGYLSNYEYAYPILKELDMKATIFIITGRMGTRNTTYPHFSWNQAKEMLDSGLVDIQSHTNTHPDLARVSTQQLWDELRISKALIEKYLGRACNVVAFPYGSANADVFWVAQQVGYKMLNIVGDKGVNRKEEGTNCLKRITVNGNWAGTDLLWVIDNNMDR